MVALAAEARLSEKAAVDLVARVNLGLGEAKSPRHVRAARVRGIPAQARSFVSDLVVKWLDSLASA